MFVHKNQGNRNDEGDNKHSWDRNRFHNRNDNPDNANNQQDEKSAPNTIYDFLFDEEKKN